MTPLPKSEGLLSTVIGQAPVALAVFDTEMRYLAVSPHFLSDLARLISAETFAPADVIGRSLYETFPSFRRRWREINSRVLAGEKLTAQESEWREDGCVEWIRWSAQPWHADDGRIGGMIVFGEIVTEEVEAKQALAESEARFRATFENAGVGMAHLSPELHWLRANATFCRIVGWPIDELVNKSLRDISHPDEFADQLARVEKMRLGKIDSYKLDKRFIRKDGEIAWGRLTVSCVRKSDGSIDYFVHVLEDISAQKQAEELRKAYEERIKMLMREARHRTNNILSLVQAVAHQTAAKEPEHFIETFTERIQALAANQDLLVENQWQGADVEDLVRVQLAHFADLVGSRITVHGPKLRLKAAAAQAAGLAVHELATNAGKYGALSTSSGRVDVNWRVDADTFAMSWVERDGPPVRPPGRRGFGSTVIESMARRAVGGEVQLDYAPSGLRWCLSCPRANALEPTPSQSDRERMYQTGP